MGGDAGADTGADMGADRERMQEGIPKPLISLQRSHDKWERIGSRCGSGYTL